MDLVSFFNIGEMIIHVHQVVFFSSSNSTFISIDGHVYLKWGQTLDFPFMRDNEIPLSNSKAARKNYFQNECIIKKSPFSFGGHSTQFTCWRAIPTDNLGRNS